MTADIGEWREKQYVPTPREVRYGQGDDDDYVDTA